MDGFARKYFKLESENTNLGNQIVDLDRKINELESENANLGQQVAALEKKLDFGSTEKFVASQRRRRFHRPGCTWAQYIYMSANHIEFSSLEEAMAAGYKPCRTCSA